MLQAGALGAFGLGLSRFLSLRALAASEAAPGPAGSLPGFGKARSCILIFQWGGPSQIDTWDPKPDAPSEIRGEFRPIPTSVPGVQISEHFPRLARLAHRYAIIRSVSHNDFAHLSSVHHVLTGQIAPKPHSDADGPSHEDFPHIGSVLTKLRPGTGSLPAFVNMPWIVSHPAAPGGRAPGQNAGWLGSRFDPLFLSGDPGDARFRVPGLGLPPEVPPSRFEKRRRLFDLLEAGSATLEGGSATLEGGSAAGSSERIREFGAFQERAMDLVSSREAAAAFDVEREDARVRDRYGRHIHGNCLLLARRLVEAGVPLVTVNWHDDGQNFWDTHGENFKHLKDRLMPPSDMGFSALIEDLEARGLLDSTLIAWVGEFGRKPAITRANAGREHWPHCYSVVLAGGGVHGGQVYGASDRNGAYPEDRPVSPSGIIATIYHALGIPDSVEIVDRLARPRRIRESRPLIELF